MDMRRSSGGVQSVDRALSILLLFSGQRLTLGVTEISQLLGLPKGTVHRLLSSLKEKGFVVHDRATGRYRLGPSLTYLGHLALHASQEPVVVTATPIMQRLQAQFDETVTLNVVLGHARVCLYKIESKQPVRTVPELGRPYPLYAGASGKVLLAHLDPDQRDEVLKRAVDEAPRLGIRLDVARLREELALIRERGFAVSRRERVADSASVSAPIRDHQGRVVAGLSISAPDFRVSDERMQVFAEAVVAAARAISEALGYLDHRADLRTEHAGVSGRLSHG